MKEPLSLRLLALALIVVTSGALAGTASPAGPALLGVPGRHNEGAWIAAQGSFVAVSWAAQEKGDNPDVFVAVSRDGGMTFGAPSRVNRENGEAYVSGELPPRVALARSAVGGDPGIVVAWTARLANTEVRVARSRDGGRTFGSPEVLQAKDAPGDRGWHALTVDQAGRAHVIWLDHRGLAEDWDAPPAPKPSAGTQPADEFAESMSMASRSGIYYHGEGQSRGEHMLAMSVCYCCKTALAAGPKGALYAAWRHVYPGSIRDIAFIASADGGRTFGTPGRVSVDGWQLDGCPDDGPAMTVGPDNRVHIVWPTVIGGTEPEGAIFYASSTDGRAFGPRIRVPTLGSPRPTHPVLALDEAGRVVVAWDEMQGTARKVVVRTMTPDTKATATFGAPVVMGAGLSASYPALATSARGVLVAWSDGVAPDGRIAVALVGGSGR
jgi:hypothetical protein